jgi:hypothetical protein
MEQIFIILFVVVLFILLTCNKKEGMCSCQSGTRGLDYYGTRKFMDWEETMRRKNKIKN